MPSSLGHALAAAAGGSALAPRHLLKPFLYPWSTRRFTLERHLIHGPFSELFYLVLPLAVITRVVFHLRTLPWPRRRIDRPQSLVR